MQDPSESSNALKQSWWHIEDELEPANGQHVIRVQDFYIKKMDFEKNNQLPIRLPPYFVGFKVRNKNSGKELSFIEEYSNDSNGTEAILKVNLGKSSDWEPVSNSEYLHYKIEHEYLDFWPIFKKRATRQLGVRVRDEKSIDGSNQLPESFLGKLKLLLPPGYEGQFIMTGISQGEISITVPPGMNIKDHGKSTEIMLYNGPVEDINTENELMTYYKPHITAFNNKRRYYYVIDNESYEKVLKFDNDKVTPEINFLVTYNVVNDGKFFLLPIFAALIIIIAVVVPWSTQNFFYFAVLLISYSTLYLSLRKEKFQIPFNQFAFYSIFISIVLVLLDLLLKYLSQQDSVNIVSYLIGYI